MRILWVSDAPWANSGYSVQTKLTAPRLARRLGHDVALLASYGLHGAALGYDGLKVYPGGADPFGNDVIARAARDWQADIVITLKDIGVYRPEALAGLRWCPLVPVDHEPAPPQVVAHSRASYRPIAYAPNGVRALRRAGLDPLYAPHGYDPAVYGPTERAAARAALGIPAEWFLVGTVAVNRGGIPSRKAWPQNLEAFALFARDKPHARYYIHTNMAPDGFEGGIPLQALIAEYGIGDKVIFADQERYAAAGFDEGYLRTMYAACDLVNCVSVGEGFGIPTLEAQAVGTPVLTGAWTASEDLNFGGWGIERGDALRFFAAQGSYIYIPWPDAIAGRIQDAYDALQHPAEAARRRAAALEGAAAYQIDAVVDTYWRATLDAIAAQIAAEAHRGVLRIVRPEEVLHAA